MVLFETACSLAQQVKLLGNACKIKGMDRG